ncbi:hypothetical protein CBR_g45399 [Chara braunii]|uniref:Uncharacterized protein n=1 Tax=Chara braunii TaxID=69332 RepID=A0A388LYQ3_CHABU|nr:hypothetical protein CBR_g45399 [Chara braunii]|eukprot:GBG87339.1 hypothetical protein CBR_g45399 [Chara braunii]
MVRVCRQQDGEKREKRLGDAEDSGIHRQRKGEDSRNFQTFVQSQWSVRVRVGRKGGPAEREEGGMGGARESSIQGPSEWEEARISQTFVQSLARVRVGTLRTSNGVGSVIYVCISTSFPEEFSVGH